MADNIIGDIYSNFERALGGFYEGAAAGISGYVIPIAWVLLGICMLIWCYLIIEGKVAMPITDWLLEVRRLHGRPVHHGKRLPVLGRQAHLRSPIRAHDAH